ncbi:MAG: type II 3-dehydroquinate dehydratase [Pseudomonadales bacterium]
MAKILVLHGPNLNLLGMREPEVYGYDTLTDIDGRLGDEARGTGHEVSTFQSNAEHELIDAIHEAQKDGVGFIIINPGAFTHTSIALRDALLGVGIPFIEVHLSNVHSREEFRQFSYLSDIAVGCITGLGAMGYSLALQAAIDRIQG